MKLESLKSSKFEAFKGMEVKNPLQVVGGLAEATSYVTYSSGPMHTEIDRGSDTWLTGSDSFYTSFNTSQHFGESGDMVSLGNSGPDPRWNDPAFQTQFDLEPVIQP